MSTTTRVEEVYQEAGRAAMEQYHIRAIVSKKTRIDLKVIGDRLLQRTRVNYEDSVDMDHPVSVDQKANPEWNQDHFCWEAKGKCAQDYKEVETKLLRELDQSRRESFCEVGVSLFMIGKTPQKAKPVIIISSQDQRSRKEAKKAITRSGILEDLDFELGVLKYLPSGPIHPIAGSPSEASWDSASESGGWDSDTWETAKPALSHQSVTSLPLPAYYDPKQRLRITGMPLYVKTTDNQSRMGTANLVHNGSTYGYITAAHIFSPLRHAPPSIDDGEEDLGVPFDSDSDDEDNSEAKRSCAGSPISNPTKATKSQILDHGETKLSRFNGSKMPSDSSEATSISPPNLALLGHVAPEESELSMDYAIIAIENIELVQQLEHFSVSEGIQSARASAAAPKPSQATAWTTHGPTHGTLTSVPTLMRLSGCRSFQPVFAFAYEGTIEYGDSGSLVLDTASKELCGMVVAASYRQSVAYIISADHLLKDIARRGWLLLSVDDAHMDSGESHDQAVYAPTTQSTQTVLPVMETSQAESSSKNIPQATPLSDKALNQNTSHTMSNGNWVWDHRYQDYYCITLDAYQRPIYHWSKQQAQADIAEPLPRQDSGSRQNDGANVAQMPEPAPQDARALRGFIQGTPQTGWYDLLDQSYRMRTGSEAHTFFVVGKVFAMLYTESAGGTVPAYPSDGASDGTSSDADSFTRSNEVVYTNIRRFVVVAVRRGFVKACGIGTYSGRGALKDGCRPSEHAIVYLPGTDPNSCYIPGEYENGMNKEAIQIEPVASSIYLTSNSRIRFGKTYPIEKNVKVKDIGQVHPEHVGRLVQYWKDEDQDQG